MDRDLGGVVDQLHAESIARKQVKALSRKVQPLVDTAVPAQAVELIGQLVLQKHLETGLVLSTPGWQFSVVPSKGWPGYFLSANIVEIDLVPRCVQNRRPLAVGT